LVEATVYSRANAQARPESHHPEEHVASAPPSFLTISCRSAAAVSALSSFGRNVACNPAEVTLVALHRRRSKLACHVEGRLHWTSVIFKRASALL